MAYEKLLMKYLGYFLIGLFGLLAILFIGFHGYYYLHAQSNAALFGGSAPELEASGHRFRDLNKNGRLDPYEDSRLSPQARTDDAGRESWRHVYHPDRQQQRRRTD